MEGLGHCVIRRGAVADILVMTNNIIILGYTYAKRRLKKPADFFCKIAHIGRLLSYIPSRLDCNMALQGRKNPFYISAYPRHFS